MMDKFQQQHQAHVVRSRQFADQNNQGTRKRSQQQHRQLVEKQANDARERQRQRQRQASFAASSSLPLTTRRRSEGLRNDSGSDSGVSAFQMLSFVVTILSITIGGAELANRLWDIGPAPSDVAVDFVDRMRDTDGASETPPEVQSPDLPALADASEELHDIVTQELDRQPPSAPTNLRVTTQDGCTNELAWDPVGDPDLATYVVRETSGMAYRVDASQTSFPFKVFPGSSTTVVVQARDADHNESGSSNELTLTC